MIELSPVAMRQDKTGGFSEEAAIREFRESSLFEVTYLPWRGAAMGVVICGSMLIEQSTTYRYEVLLARCLAARGMAVQRFHYRGSGHSGGQDVDTTWPTMVEDALGAVAQLRDRAAVRRVALAGVRWGALVAAAAAQEDPDSPLVLWEPAVDGERYFRGLIRGRLVSEMKDPRAVGVSSDVWRAEFDQQGFIEIFGHPLHRHVYESGRSKRLEALLSAHRGPVFVVQFGRHWTPRHDLSGLRTVLDKNGTRLDVRFVREEPAWFFPGYWLRSIDKLVSMTGDWLQSTASTIQTS